MESFSIGFTAAGTDAAGRGRNLLHTLLPVLTVGEGPECLVLAISLSFKPFFAYASLRSDGRRDINIASDLAISRTFPIRSMGIRELPSRWRSPHSPYGQHDRC